jgi:hypothetical protein
MVLGSRTATILPRLTFSAFFFASHSSAHCSKGRGFSVLGSLPSLSRHLALSRSHRVRNSQSRRERLFSRYEHDTNKSGGRDRMRTNGDEHRCTRKRLFSRGSEMSGGRFGTGLNSLVGALAGSVLGQFRFWRKAQRQEPYQVLPRAPAGSNRRRKASVRTGGFACWRSRVG